MLIILPKKKEDKFEKEKPSFDKYSFMKDSQEVLDNPPKTWEVYPKDAIGGVGIVDMEYKEFKKADTKESMQHELIHLATACYHLWEMLNESK